MGITECHMEAKKPIRAMINNTIFVQGPTQEKRRKPSSFHTNENDITECYKNRTYIVTT